MLALVFQAGLVAAEPTRITFEGSFYNCGFTNGEKEWVSGNVFHFRGATNHNLWVVGNELIDGFADNVVDANINLKTGNGVAKGQEVLKPDAVEGSWLTIFIVDVSASGLSVHAVGHGTGALHGMTLKWTGGEEVPVEENPCNPDFLTKFLVRGEIVGRPS